MNQQDIDILMSYLYGEMDASEKQELEVRLAQDAALRSEWQELQQTRGLLQTATKQGEAPPPVVIAQASPKSSMSRQWLASRWLQVAAAVALLMFAGRMSGLQIASQDGQLLMAFGEIKTATTIPTTDPWQQRLAEQQLVLEEELCVLSETLLKPQQATLSKTQVNQIRKSLLGETKQNFQQFFQTAKEEQSAQTAMFLEQFALLVQQQREQDLEAIEFALNDLLQQTEYQQSETDIILSEIINRLEEGR